MASSSPSSTGTALSERAIRHVNFFNGRLVTSGDMTRTQEAQTQADARLGQGLGAGVVRGLEIAITDAAQRQLSITPGLAISACGQTLRLGAAQTLALVPAAETTDAGADSGDFGRCGVLSGGGYVAGNGLYLLTLAPLPAKEGKAPVLALEAGNVRCNVDAIVDAVQLRLLRIGQPLLAKLGLDANPVGAAALSRWRSAVAYACFGFPALQNAHAQIGQAPATGGLLEALQPAMLTERDVPLGLVYLSASAGIAFIDAWAVRRRVAGKPASKDWSAWFGPGLEALGEAQLAQFQQQLAEIPTSALAGLRAQDWFSWLPPAGFLDASGARAIDGLAFLAGRQPARQVALAPGDVRALLGQALRRDAVKLEAGSSQPRFRLYRVDGGPQFFVREAPNAPHAQEVWLDGERARLPGANDVQSAIDALRGRVCGALSVWPGADVQGLIDQQKAGSDLHLCFEAGNYRLERPLRLQNLGHVIVHGQGPASLLQRLEGEAALIVEGCASLRICELALLGGKSSSGKTELGSGLLGALTVLDVPQVHIERVSAVCPGAAQANAACIVVRQTVLVDEATAVKRAAEAETEVDLLERELRKLGKLPADSGDQHLRLPAATHASILDCELQVGAAQIGILCVDNALTDIRHNRLSALSQRQPPERGIVVAGSQATGVTICHNRVSYAAQGIAIGLSRSDAPNDPPLSVQRAELSHNTVHIALGKRDVKRNRFGIFVGNADSLALEGNRVTFSDAVLARELQMEAIRLSGVYGLHLSVRANHLSGTPVGINFTPQAPLPERLALGTHLEGVGVRPCLWLFDANLSEPPSVVIQVEKSVRELIIDRDNL
jgi:hypothetical protein